MKTHYSFFEKMVNIFTILVVSLFVLCVLSVFYVWGIVTVWVFNHQWIAWILDGTCMVLLSLLIYKSFVNPFYKEKTLFTVFLVNILLIGIVSLGAYWNVLVIVFIMLPISCIIDSQIRKINVPMQFA
jgi:hypothetical protein